MKNTDKRGALKNSSKDNTYRKKQDSAKSKPDSVIRTIENISGSHRKNLGAGKTGPYMGNPRVSKAGYNSKEHSAYGSSLMDHDLGANHKKGKPMSQGYSGSNLSKNYTSGPKQSGYYRGNTLNVRNMTSAVEGQGI